MKGVITVLGKDKVGIMANVCNYLAENKINILDISQTILKGYFNMIMIVEFAENSKQLEEVSKDLEEIGLKMDLIISTRHEDIFNSMHRI